MMELEFFASRFKKNGNWAGYRKKTVNTVLLREPERCMECNKVYLSLYPLRSCKDHEGLDKF